jgi:hypothetical protein
MAITTLDQALAGMQVPQFFYRGLTGTLVAGRPHSLFYENAGQAGDNIPGAAAIPGAIGVTGTALTTYAGQIPFPAISSGNRYLAKFAAQATIGGVLMLCDRLWHNQGINVSVSTTQTINSVTWPARDNAGAIDGAGVIIGVEVTGTLGAGTPNYVMTYTNSDGTGSRTAGNIVSTATTAIQGVFTPMGLQAGDKGVKSIQSFQQSGTHTSGTISLVAYRVLSTLCLSSGWAPDEVDLISGGFPRLYADTVPFLLFVPATTTSSNVMGQIVYSDG